MTDGIRDSVASTLPCTSFVILLFSMHAAGAAWRKGECCMENRMLQQHACRFSMHAAGASIENKQRDVKLA
jgi:hypothetical protein